MRDHPRAGPMLPVTIQFIVAMLAYALNERMSGEVECLRGENRILKEALQAATGKRRVPLTDEQRRRLATKGEALTPAERERDVFGQYGFEAKPMPPEPARTAVLRAMQRAREWLPLRTVLRLACLSSRSFDRQRRRSQNRGQAHRCEG